MKKNRKIDISAITPLILSVIVMCLGMIILSFKTLGLINILLFVSILFYIYSFFCVLLYFVGRREGDYEILLHGLINVVTATFLFIFKDSHISILLGAAMIVYTILVIANRGFKIMALKQKNSFMWIVKFMVTFLISVLGALTSINLYMEATVQTLMFAYYFMSLGFLYTVESLIELFITEDKFRKLLKKVLEDEEKLEIVTFNDKDEKKSKPKVTAKKTVKKTTTKTTKAKTTKKITKELEK